MNGLSIARCPAPPEACSANVVFESPDAADVRALVDALDAYQKPLYPPESHHGIDLEALRQPHVRFAVLRLADGRAIGCGAVVLDGSGGGELKRFWLEPAERGGGRAQRLLAALEAAARRDGATVLRLETGIHQHAALAFYARAGYLRRAPFAPYAEDPLSVFMEKQLSAPTPGMPTTPPTPTTPPQQRTPPTEPS